MALQKMMSVEDLYGKMDQDYADQGRESRTREYFQQQRERPNTSLPSQDVQPGEPNKRRKGLGSTRRAIERKLASTAACGFQTALNFLTSRLWQRAHDLTGVPMPEVGRRYASTGASSSSRYYDV